MFLSVHLGCASLDGMRKAWIKSERLKNREAIWASPPVFSRTRILAICSPANRVAVVGLTLFRDIQSAAHIAPQKERLACELAGVIGRSNQAIAD